MTQRPRDLYLSLYNGTECEACGAVPALRNLEIHHRFGYSVPEAPRNLIALCKSCHSRSDPERPGEPRLEIHREIAEDFQ